MAACIVCSHWLPDGERYCSQECADVDAYDTADERAIAFVRDDDDELEQLQQLADA